MAENSVSAGTASDVKTFAAAALLTYSGGALMLVGYILLSGAFGAILGLVGAVFGVIWWRSAHDKKIFPRDLSRKSLVILVVAGVVLTSAAVALMQ